MLEFIRGGSVGGYRADRKPFELQLASCSLNGMWKSSNFKSGDRVKLSERGRQASPRTQKHRGVVFYVPPKGTSIEVVFEGNKAPTRIHRSYVELDADPSDQSGH
jgi:hypothetical protein